MAFRLKLILLFLLSISMITHIWGLKHRYISLRYTFSWILLEFILAVLVCVPKFLQIISDFVGIDSPMNMIFFCGFIFVLFGINILTVSITKLLKEVTILAQEIAIINESKS